MKNKKTWKCCVKEPSETGRKVLCCKGGDIYVAMRFKNYYIPMPFADHYYATDLAQPDMWCEIDFPGNLTGQTLVMASDGSETMTMSEFEVDYPKDFNEIASKMINGIGKLKRPKNV